MGFGFEIGFIDHLQVVTTSNYSTIANYHIVGIVTGYGLDDRGVGVRVPVGQEFSLLQAVHIGSGSTQPPIKWVQGTLSPGVKRPGRETDHSTLASAEVKKMWIYTSTPPYTFMA
jgi:hypothetical protein